MSLPAFELDDLTLSDEWRMWIVENKMQGVSDELLVELLVKNDIDETLARREVASISEDNPCFLVGRRFIQKFKKAESLLGVYRDLSSLTSTHNTIERRVGVSRQEFLESYYAPNRPVILTDIMKNWKALGLWSPEYFRSVCGDEIVEVMTGRESKPNYEINLDAHRTQMLMRDYVDMVVNGGESNDYYMTANNYFLQREGMRRLFGDMEIFPEYLNPHDLDGKCALWFGPAGTVTALHHDIINIFMAQVYGRKRVALIPSYQLNLVYNNIGVYSEVNLENASQEDYPLMARVEPVEVTLAPGEVLFLPVGWWHQVRALDNSITVSFINFLFPNKYEWNHPELS